MTYEDNSGDELIEKFKKLDVCCVSDAMDRLGIRCGLEGDQGCRFPGASSAAGPLRFITYPAVRQKAPLGIFLMM